MNRFSCLALALSVASFAVTAGSVAAPAPNPGQPQPPLHLLRAALGKNHLGKEVRAVTRALGEYPTLRPNRVVFSAPADVFGGPAWQDDGRLDDAYYLTWKTRGIEMAFRFGELAAIFLYNEKADGFDRYPGELPGGLTFGDDPTAIERKLGQPDQWDELSDIRKVGGKLQDELWMTYDDSNGLGIWIILRRVQREPFTIHSIHLSKPKKE